MPKLISSMPGVTINDARKEVFVNGKRVYLARREYQILQYLYTNRDRIVTRPEVIEKIWGGAEVISDTRTVDQHIARFRKKFGKCQPVETVHNFGYRWALS